MTLHWGTADAQTTPALQAERSRIARGPLHRQQSRQLHRTQVMRSVVSWPTSLSALGRLKNQTTSFFGLQPLVAHADVGDGPIYVPAYRSGERPFDVKLDPGARRRMRTVS